MSIPLVQNNEKDSINTSIIAIKRNIERINMLLGLSNSEEIDTSKFATKEELQQAVTDLQPVDEVAVDNMHSVTSNAVAESLSYSTTEQKTGGYWIDGKPIYKKSGYISSISSVPYIVDSVLTDTYVDVLIESKASMKYYASKVVVYGYTSATDRFSLNATSSGLTLVTNFSLGDIANGFYWSVEYTKTTD